MNWKRCHASIVALCVCFLALSCARSIRVRAVFDVPGHAGSALQGGRSVKIVFLGQREQARPVNRMVEQALLEELTRRNYFRMLPVIHIDKDNEKDTGPKGNEKQRKDSMKLEGPAADLLLYVQVLGERRECVSEDRPLPRALQFLTFYKATGYAANSVYHAVYVNVRLVRAQTGASVESTSTALFALSRWHVFRDPCTDDHLNEAAALAARQLAEKISPRVVLMPVPLEAGARGVPEAKRAQVEKALEAGLDAASGETPDYARSAAVWESILAETPGSLGALWNLALYCWSLGELDRARGYFNRALQVDDADWLDHSRREIITAFDIAAEKLLGNEAKE